VRKLLILSLLLSPAALAQGGAEDGPPVAVVGFKWAKSRQVVVNPAAQDPSAPAAAMIPQNKNFSRNARVNDPAGVRDPNLDTIDGRAAALEKNVQEARSPKSKPVDGYAYQVRVRNAASKQIDVVFWEYEFAETADSSNVTRRQFLCGAQIKPEKEKELEAFSLSPPSGAISAGSLADKSASPFRERAVINRVEYSDGSIWQRKGWNFAEVRAAVARATATPRGSEVCRGL
jgi:hypothetical protein